MNNNINKKYIYIGLQVSVLLILVILGFSLFGQTKNKSLLMIIDKVYVAYSDFIKDAGYSPSNIEELYTNNKNDVRWSGPYITEQLLKDYKDGEIAIIQASNIPTKECPLESIINCYSWIKVTNISNGDYSQIKESINPNSDIFFADNQLFFKITNIE